MAELGFDDGALGFAGCCAVRSIAGFLRESERDLRVAFATSVANTYLSFVDSFEATASPPVLSAAFAAPLLRDVAVVVVGFVRVGFKFSFCAGSLESSDNSLSNVSTVAGVHVEMDATAILMFWSSTRVESFCAAIVVGWVGESIKGLLKQYIIHY